MLIIVLVYGLSGCHGKRLANQLDIQNFEQQAKNRIKEKAYIYTEEEFQTANVPIHAWVQLSGEIIQSDQSKEIVKGDRFILKSGSSRYQIFNDQEEILKIGDSVTVYGEYYGFIKGVVIERKETNERVYH
ncbi:hypothetical protein A5844_000422 [Enterococcus sp. 10A9_DIV0425]|uniref:Uncharacterized protein n=1 Tax=Candidatus Enterococcus wittei TaxID=1987383 RepID=A0A2C9XS25_9ENTE|nr:hypothetical protein [Enterococcus sp. 10A9_DIV0425]OTP12206.1 hypothetical protein A5844_000422 [Enterococcus sp. 10A9_DIV0425]